MDTPELVGGGVPTLSSLGEDTHLTGEDRDPVQLADPLRLYCLYSRLWDLL